MATLDELTEEVLSHQFSASQYDQFIRDRINECEKKLFAEIDFRAGFTRTTVSALAGYPLYYLHFNFQRVYNVTYERSDGTIAVLEETPFTELDKLNPDQSGEPKKYAVTGLATDNAIQIWPVPDASYSIRVRYYAVPGGMTDGSDTPGTPTQWQDLLVQYALIKCYERENDYNSAQYHRNIYELNKEKAKGQAQYDAEDYGQPNLVGEARTDPLAPRAPQF